MRKLRLEETFILFDDESVKEKLTVMSKYEVILDDERNPITKEWEDEINKVLELGKTYKLIFIVEEINV